MDDFDLHRLPADIARHVAGLSFSIDDLGRSGDQVVLFDKRFILKISSDIPRLVREKERIDWMGAHIPSSQSVCFVTWEDRAYYLRTYLDGENLCARRFRDHPPLLIDMLRKAVALLRSLDDQPCPFDSTDSIGDGFVHGDLCLPNILVNAHNEIVGFIDLDNAGRGDPWYDYAWMLWSLAYNLKTTDYNAALLEAIGVPFSEEKYNLYIPSEYR